MTEPVKIAAVADIAVGESVVVPAGAAGTRDDVAVIHAEDGRFYAVDNTCTHGAFELAGGFVEDATVECPAHGARFCLRTGEALTLPATVPVGTHRVEERDGVLWLLPDADSGTEPGADAEG